ncbi:sugar phosphate isomerase/epimerase and 4-hydroxyphenylpyruvate domain-containing protein [soil metagenome]
MKTAIATVCLSGALDEKLEAIARAGFERVELFENDLLSYSGSPADVRRMIDDCGLSTITFQPFRDFEGMPDSLRERALTRAERKFDVMEALGCDLLMVCSNVSPDGLGGIDRAAADLRELAERGARRGLRIGFEALAWGRHINDYRDAWEAVRRADHPAVGVVLDSFHILARGTDLSAIRSIPRDRISLVQVADAPKLDMDYLSWSRHFRNIPGQGDLPLDDFMDALAATGYDDLFSLEIFNDQFRAGSTRQVAIDGHRSLINLLDRLRRRSGKAVPGLPARARCLGVEFLEFALDDQAAVGFEQLLMGLGLRRTGQHVSKSVTRWCQGDINIVVNTEKEGFAHSYNLTHGTAVCALGLRVEDAAATLDRAQLLLDTPFRQAVGPGELQIPAVRGLGGGLVYFIDSKTDLARVWDIEFHAVADAPSKSDAGLRRVDHLSPVMLYDEMLSWLLFYTSLLDIEKTPAQDVLDPGGLVKSQVVQSDDGSLRLVQNGSQSTRAQSSRFLSEAFGSGVQHIALATGDLLATVRQLAANGVTLLPVPENYYDDLEAKSELSVALIETLKSHNIFYDREGDAEYFQVYTATVEDRFFFEIVERRGYRGYGAVNAPIRLAAQARLTSEQAGSFGGRLP